MTEYLDNPAIVKRFPNKIWRPESDVIRKNFKRPAEEEMPDLKRILDDLAARAIREEYGSEQQIECEIAFFDMLEDHWGLDMDNFAHWTVGTKGTVDDNIDTAYAIFDMVKGKH